jgi:hypothetical protein
MGDADVSGDAEGEDDNEVFQSGPATNPYQRRKALQQQQAARKKRVADKKEQEERERQRQEIPPVKRPKGRGGGGKGGAQKAQRTSRKAPTKASVTKAQKKETRAGTGGLYAEKCPVYYGRKVITDRKYARKPGSKFSHSLYG